MSSVDLDLPAVNGKAPLDVDVLVNGDLNVALNGHANGHVSQLADINPSKLKITLTNSPGVVPASGDALEFGKTHTDHMLVLDYDPTVGWSAPEIKPYGPLSLDPASNVLQYSSNLFEGMKAYVGPDGEPRLFRPELNMKRMELSTERLALPPFDTSAFLVLIKKLVSIDKKWVPKGDGFSLYIRPTLIGTTPSIKVGASIHAMLYVILCPSGPYFPKGQSALSLLAVSDTVRSWPGGTGGHKLGLNYSPGFAPLKVAAKLGYQQILWLLGDDKRITEAGAMNFFAVVKRDEDDGWDVLTPPLDGTILPGITRLSVMSLCDSHSKSTPLEHISPTQKLHVSERVITMSDLATWSASGKLLEVIVVGTAVLVTSVSRIGHNDGGKVEDIVLPDCPSGLGPLAQALYDRLFAIQTGRLEWEGWSVRCD